VRDVAGPDVPIGVDANCGWSLSAAKSTLRQLEVQDLRFVEQPIAPGDAAALAELRRAASAPIMADESLFTLADAWQLAWHRAADVWSVYPGKHGGIAATIEIAHLARACGAVCAIGSNLELGVGTAAMLHVAAAEPAIASATFPADLIGPLYHESDLLQSPLALGPVAARPPSGPGLGVELDEEQLRRWRVDG
jgi:muconate cycloisomerase